MQESKRIKYILKKEPSAVTQTAAQSVGLCCHVAHGPRQTVSLSPSCLCLLGDDRGKSTFASRQQASGRLSGDLGGKGEKGRLCCRGEERMCLHGLTLGGLGVHAVAAGDSTVAAIVRKLQIDQIVEARL